MGIVKYKNPKTGIIYCYESTPKWDPEKGQARPTRTYLGRWDEETQSIIPTNGRRGRPKKQDVPAEESAEDGGAAELAACRAELSRCREEKAMRHTKEHHLRYPQAHIRRLPGVMR